MKPVIGIVVDTKPDPADARTNGHLKLNWNYPLAVSEAGGVPLLIPPQADAEVILSLIDGLLIPGGNDIDAGHFSEPNHPSVKLIEPERFELEQRLLDRVPEEMPYLGICYGCQRLNVHRGGSLMQHIPDQLGHDLHSTGELQEYQMKEGSVLHGIIGNEGIGESWHHQVVGRIGNSLAVVATDKDQIPEAIEDQSKPFCVGVQWHPERTRDSETSKALFAAFIKAASEYRAKRSI